MKVLADYQWSVEGEEQPNHVSLFADQHGGCTVCGGRWVPSTVAEAIKFMYKVSAKKLVVDEYTIVAE